MTSVSIVMSETLEGFLRNIGRSSSISMFSVDALRSRATGPGLLVSAIPSFSFAERRFLTSLKNLT